MDLAVSLPEGHDALVRRPGNSGLHIVHDPQLASQPLKIRQVRVLQSHTLVFFACACNEVRRVVNTAFNPKTKQSTYMSFCTG